MLVMKIILLSEALSYKPCFLGTVFPPETVVFSLEGRCLIGIL